VTPAGWLGLAVLTLGMGAFCLALFGVESLVQAIVGVRDRYVRWASGELRALQMEVSVQGFFLRHLLFTLGGFGFGLMLGSPVKAVVFAALGVASPLVLLKRARLQYQARLNEQLDPGLQLMGNAILATQNLVDGFDALAKHGSPPLSAEADLLVKELRVGASIDEAMANMAQRCRNRNVDAVITALSIGRRTGGNLPKVLDLIARVLRETMRVEGMMAAKTSEGRASGWIMSMMPVAFMLIMSVVDPEWTAPLYNDIVGNFILAIVIVLTGTGALLMRKVSTIDA
jgi:tight adherence protein B